MKRLVFRNHHHAPYLASAALIGIVLGTLERLYEPIDRFLSPRFGVDWNPFVAAFISIAVVVIMRRDCPHPRWRFAMGAAAAVGAFVALVLFDAFNGAPPPNIGKLASDLVAATVLSGLIGGLLGYGLWKLRDVLLGAPLIQDGSYCVNCAYTILGLPESRCPECGKKFDETDIDPNPSPVSRAWRGVGSLAATTLLFAGTIYLAFPHLVVYGLVRDVVDIDLAASYLKFRPSASAKILGGYLDHENARKRAHAAYMLIRFPCCASNELDSLRRLAVSDPDPLVRSLAVQTIGRIAPHLLESMMADLLADLVPSNRWMALASSAPYGDGVPEPSEWVIAKLIAALDDPDSATRGFVHNRLSILTGQKFPLTPTAPRDVRLAQQAVWSDWWNKRTAEKERSANP